LSEPDYAALQAAAEAEGLRIAVGALIVDASGRAFVHRRGWDRSLFPGCWDIVGGHVEPGEGMLEALAREVEEETGWRVAGTPVLVDVADWDGRREFDFLVDVEGDLSRPRLEVPQHVEFRWVGPDDLSLLDENLNVDGGMIRRLVELALRLQQVPGTGRVANEHVGGQSPDVAGENMAGA
jgi:8-oxo-dGTP diphosphatase